MDSWTESSWLNSENGAVFFMDPDHGATAEPVIFAQLTVPVGTPVQGSLSAQGRSASAAHDGQRVDDWVVTALPFQSNAGPGAEGGSGAGDAASDCPTLWTEEEEPVVHELNLVMAPADFHWLVDHQDLQYDLKRSMRVDRVEFGGGDALGGAELAVHGGKYQRNGGRWGTSADQASTRGGDCYLARAHDRDAPYKCKPSFRLKLSKDDPLSKVFPEGLFRFPIAKRSCNKNARKLVLRGEWVSAAASPRLSDVSHCLKEPPCACDRTTRC